MGDSRCDAKDVLARSKHSTALGWLLRAEAADSIESLKLRCFASNLLILNP